MPGSARSLALTDSYRRRLGGLEHQTRAVVRNGWGDIRPDDLEGTHRAWTRTAAATVDVGQRAGVRLTAAYLAVYLTSETGRRVAPAQVNERKYAGWTRAGAPLEGALGGSLFTVLAAVKDGRDITEALSLGLVRAERRAGDETVAAARRAMDDQLSGDDRIVGWRRVTSGGCGACIAAATGAIQETDATLPVHSSCKCSKEPVVRDVRETTLRPTGPEMFNQLPAEKQNQLLGEEKARLVRDGQIAFSDLIAVSPMATIDDQITEAPLKALT